MKRVFSILALLVLGATYAAGQTHDMSGMSGQLQSVQGVASDSDAQRHYLLHAASLNGALTPAAVTGTSNSNDSSVILTSAQEFQTWFLNAIQNFNDVQSTRTDSAAQASALATFITERDAQVAYYFAQINAKLTPQGQRQLARVIKGRQSMMKSGISQDDYDKLRLTKAEQNSDAALGGGAGPGSYTCNDNFHITCSLTYSVSAAQTSPYSSTVFDVFHSGLGNWNQRYGSFQIVNNFLEVATGGGSSGHDAAMYWKTTTNQNDQFSRIVLENVPGAGNGIGVALRMSSSSQTYYQAYFYNNSGTQQVRLDKYINGVGTNLSSINVSFASGATLVGIAQQGIIGVYLKGAKILEVHDTSITTGQPGIMANNVGTPASVLSWSGGSLGSTLQQSLIIDGSQAMTGNTTATHTPSVTSFINAVGTTYNGAGVCTTCYLYADGEFFIGAPGVVEIGDGSTAGCSASGQFFATGNENGFYENAVTYVTNTDPNATGGGTVFINGPDGAYEWAEPYFNFVDQNANLTQWEWFTSAGTQGYTYSVSNNCTNTSAPDADFSNYKVVLPKLYLSGGSWGNYSIAAEGKTMIITTPLWRFTTTSKWSTIPWFSPLQILFGVDDNEPWNEATSDVNPLVNAITSGGVCTVTSGNYGVKVPIVNACLEHNNNHDSDGNIIPCTH